MRKLEGNPVSISCPHLNVDRVLLYFSNSENGKKLLKSSKQIVADLPMCLVLLRSSDSSEISIVTSKSQFGTWTCFTQGSLTITLHIYFLFTLHLHSQFSLSLVLRCQNCPQKLLATFWLWCNSGTILMSEYHRICKLRAIIEECRAQFAIRNDDGRSSLAFIPNGSRSLS